MLPSPCPPYGSSLGSSCQPCSRSPFLQPSHPGSVRGDPQHGFCKPNRPHCLPTLFPPTHNADAPWKADAPANDLPTTHKCRARCAITTSYARPSRLSPSSRRPRRTAVILSPFGRSPGGRVGLRRGHVTDEGPARGAKPKSGIEKKISAAGHVGDTTSVTSWTPLKITHLPRVEYLINTPRQLHRGHPNGDIRYRRLGARPAWPTGHSG